MAYKNLSLGIDIGSTTTKLVLTENEKIIYEKYERHLSKVRETTYRMLQEMNEQFNIESLSVAVSGSAGMGVAEDAGLTFIQEVYATGEVIYKLEPDTNVVIELGGEDAKVIFFDKAGTDERMNGTCAGGTGAFIDQMAVLLNMTVDEMDKESLKAEKIYPIASRCGVFAKTDIQPLLNQGAKKSDIAKSIYQSVVNQTVTGLIQGRKIEGKVMFLGGPLFYCEGLKERFKETLGLDDNNAIFPDYARFAVAMGASMHASKLEKIPFETLLLKIKSKLNNNDSIKGRLEPLFKDEKEYDDFIKRHNKATVPTKDIESYKGNAWLGIDCGSTTTKLCLISDKKEILYSYYSSNKGNPVTIVKEQLIKIRELTDGKIEIKGAAVTGYGEELIKNAFSADEGVVETIAHYTAAKHFMPKVDFILDIGGQDIKCFKIKNGAIDSIMLNEACSSGCGSFVETFAKSMGYAVKDFAKLGTFAKAPVNLGSRCTVFMNSSVKQSQKDGASVEDISAGLSVSVVKNAIYKVIRAVSTDELGENIVVQGGTFYNDSVLRAFEKEIKRNVIRPSVAGLMGAYGAALYIMKSEKSTLLTKEELLDFTHNTKTAICKGCGNNCHLTINIFNNGKRFISGNQCEKALGVKKENELFNMYEWKRNYLSSLERKEGKRGIIGIPMALSTYELAPLWHGLFENLGFEVCFSDLSTRRTYEKGQFTIPSDTACYPAKIMHGHILELYEKNIKNIFYPCITYNINEKAGDNHFNCPVVAYYSELLKGNMEILKEVNFMYPYLNIDSPLKLAKTIYKTLKNIDDTITFCEVLKASGKGFAEYKKYREDIKIKALEILKEAEEKDQKIMVLSGRPYHIDPEISHGIDKLILSLGFIVLTEDSVSDFVKKEKVNVLDQWTFHSRLYRAARFVTEEKRCELVQLVSFGCGVDAITSDEVRRILEEKGKHYTQIKIDEITNLGAVKIRLRSLIGAIKEEEENEK